MGVRRTAWFGLGNSGCRCARRAFAYALTMLLCIAAHGAVGNLSVVPLTLLGAEDERASDETARETVSKLHRLGFSCPRDRDGLEGRLPAPVSQRAVTAFHQPVSLAVHSLGAGVSCRC